LYALPAAWVILNDPSRGLALSVGVLRRQARHRRAPAAG
jgi:hypothetical protein